MTHIQVVRLLSLSCALCVARAQEPPAPDGIGEAPPPAGRIQPEGAADLLTGADPAVPIADALRPLSGHRLMVGGELGRRIDVTIHNNIRKLDLNRHFTDHFVEKRGPDVAGGFIGMGMLIDATARFAAFSRDPDMVVMKDDMVDAIIDAQLPDGYAGFYRPDRRLWDRSATSGDNWDIHELAFIIDGLLTDYELSGGTRSLEAAVQTADYILDRWAEMPSNYGSRVDLHVLDTGIDWAVLRLYQLTGHKRFLEFSTDQKSLYDWDTDIVIGRRSGVSGHMFAYLAMCLSQLELYRITGDAELLQQTAKAMHFLVAEDGLTITGSAGQREIWTNDQDGENALGETCATAYQLRVYESLLRLTGGSHYGDLIERTILNGLFAAQSPDGDQLRYYTPFEGPRHYYAHQHMCCPGNFRRIVSEIPGMVYYRTQGNGIAVNLYSASSATLPLAEGTDVRIEQITEYPSSGQIELRLTLSEASRFPVLLRIPSWATGAAVTVNGADWKEPVEAGTFLRIEREWSSGDKVLLTFPMTPRFIRGRRRQSGRIAIMRGPVIYGLNLEANPAATLDGKRTFNDLRRILLDPSTLSDVVEDDSLRPGGTALYIDAWRENHSRLADIKHEFRLKLTEFPDPGNQFIYFKVPDYSVEEEDELFGAPHLCTGNCR